MDEPLIVQVIQHYHPDWKPPRDTGREWLKCHCPWHGDETASAAVSYKNDAFGCLGCEVRGSAHTLVMKQEGVPFAEAKRLATNLFARSDIEVPPEPRRKRSRRVFAESGTLADEPASRKVPARIRRRTFDGT